jgi:hypothetical protein
MPCLKRPMSKQEFSSRQKDSKLPLINPNAAGIDIGADRHWVSVPVGRHRENVRSFACFTADLYAMADWLKQCQIETVAMESTGVYWIPVFQILESRGWEHPTLANIPLLVRYKRIIKQRGYSMTPEKQARLKACIQELAAIRYEEVNAKELSSLESIEKTVRQQMLEHVSPQIALFLSSK